MRIKMPVNARDHGLSRQRLVIYMEYGSEKVGESVKSFDLFLFFFVYLLLVQFVINAMKRARER